jgi:hypothetical protein
VGRVVRRPAAEGGNAHGGGLARALATGVLDVGGLGLLVWCAAELHPTAGLGAGGLALLLLGYMFDQGDDEQLQDDDPGRAA